MWTCPASVDTRGQAVDPREYQVSVRPLGVIRSKAPLPSPSFAPAAGRYSRNGAAHRSRPRAHGRPLRFARRRGPTQSRPCRPAGRRHRVTGAVRAEGAIRRARDRRLRHRGRTRARSARRTPARSARVRAEPSPWRREGSPLSDCHAAAYQGGRPEGRPPITCASDARSYGVPALSSF